MRQIHPYDIEAIYTDENKAKQNRTVLLNNQMLSEKEVEEEENQRVLMYDLYLGAQSLKLAKKMERERKEYFESLYEFSYGISNVTDEPLYLGSTESKALNIIDEKESYDLKITKLKERYSRFKGVLSGLNLYDSNLLRNYFENGYRVDYEELRACIGRLSSHLNVQEEAREKALDAEAVEDLREYRKQNPEKFRKEIKPIEPGQKHFNIDGRFVYMTDEGYRNYQLQQTKKRQAFQQEIADTFETA